MLIMPIASESLLSS